MAGVNYGLFGQRIKPYNPRPKSSYSGSVLDYLPSAQPTYPTVAPSYPKPSPMAGIPAPRDFTEDTGTHSSTPGYALPSGTWGASDSPFNNMRGAVSSMVGGLRKVLNPEADVREALANQPTGAAAMVPPVAAAVAPHSLTPPTAYPSMAQGPYPAPAASQGPSGGSIPMPRERPYDLADMPPMQSAMQAQDPSKIIMYGTADNPSNFDWRKLFGS